MDNSDRQPFRVFVFPSCNEPGLETINALTKSNKFILFGGSSYDTTYDPSRFVLENYVHCPGYDEQDFEQQFRSILEAHDIDLVFPAWDPLVAIFSKWRMDKTVFVTPNAEVAELLLSKSATYARLDGIVPVPGVYDPDEVTFPAFAKPDRGSGSRDTMVVRSADELRVAIQKGLLVTEYLPGAEFTVDCISDLSGRLMFSNVRIRGHIGRGIALGTKTVQHERIAECVKSAAAELRIEGPWFAQFKLDDQNQPKLIEINARIAGSMTLTRMSGVNIPLIAAFMFTGHEVKVPRMVGDVLINRSLQTVGTTAPFNCIIWDLDDTIIRKDGKPDPDVMACLYDFDNRGVKQILLSKNPDLESVLARHRIPPIFIEVRFTEDKLQELERVVRTCGVDIDRCVLVNDSYQENLAIQDRLPSLRTVTPDALPVLGREPIS